MQRMSITLDDNIARTLRGIQGRLIEKFEKDISFTTIVNTVLLAGVIGTESFTEKTWTLLSQFLHEEQINLDKEGLTDNFVNQLK
ncbi:MAG: hypothetical protein ACT4N5_01390 [Nitrosopumilaceae archaeon]